MSIAAVAGIASLALTAYQIITLATSGSPLSTEEATRRSGKEQLRMRDEVQARKRIGRSSSAVLKDREQYTNR
jgi:hypothetical protein